MWAVDGTWERIFTALLARADAEGDLDRVVAVDSTIVRADQHAAGAHPNGPRPCAGGAQRIGRPRTTPDTVLTDKTSHADRRQAAAAASSGDGCGKAIASSYR